MKTKMNSNIFRSLAVISGCFILPLVLSACGSAPSSNTYTTAQAGKLQKVQLGEVIAVRSVMIEQNSGETGTVAGGVIGGAAGSDLSKDKTTSIIGGMAGAVVGGAVGSVIDKAIQAKQGVEITLKLEKENDVVVIVQLADDEFKVGQKVKVVSSNGISRVTPL